MNVKKKHAFIKEMFKLHTYTTIGIKYKTNVI